MSVTFDEVRRLVRTFGDVEEGTSYGTPAFRGNGTLFARLREDGDTLVVRTTFEQRDALIAEDPDTYYVTDHYLNYQWVLVRLSRIHPDALRDILHAAWRSAAAAKASRGTRRVQAHKPPRRKPRSRAR